MPRAAKQDNGPDVLNMSSAYVQSLPVGLETGEAVPSALLFMDHERYVFNCGESFQRCCVENKIKMTKLNGILLTRISFSSCSGLPGTILTLADSASATRAPLTIYGPRNLGSFMNATASYNEYSLRDLQLNVEEFGRECTGVLCEALPKPVVQSQAVTIHGFILLPATSGASCEASQAGHVAEKAGATPALAHAADLHNVTDTAAAPTAASNSQAPPARGVLADGVASDAAEGQSSSGPDKAPELGSEPPAKRQKVESGAGSGQQSSGARSSGVMAMCYVCKVANVRGKFLPQKAMQLGVPRGPLFKQLTLGQSVQTPAGETVTPDMCMEGDLTGEVIVVVDCPSEAHLPALHKLLPALEPFAGAGDPGAVALVMHLTPASVADTAGYAAWVARLPAFQHLHAGFPYDVTRHSPTLRSSCAMQVKLNILCPDLYPLPAVFGAPMPDDSAVGSSAGASDVPDNQPVNNAPPPSSTGDAREARRLKEAPLLARYVLRPVAKRGLDLADVPPLLSVADVKQELETDNADAIEAAAAVTRQSPASTSAHQTDTFQVVFLGTGAAMPSKYRNVTAIYVDLYDKGGLLLDCGEGTLGQLRRRFGRRGAEERLRALRCVWISHIHADHHVGLPALLEERARLLGGDAAPPIPLFGPFPLRKVLSACARLAPLRYDWIDQYHLTPREEGDGRNLDFFWNRLAQDAGVADKIDRVKDALGLERMRSVLVEHCKHAFGVVLESHAGWKVVFSGDTQRCGNLVAAAAGATLLVHEATFENDMAEDARHKKHSTIADALEVGKLSKCENLVLTHFSQRYPRVPVLSDAASAATGVAFDMMTVNPRNLHALPTVIPVLEKLFKDEDQVQSRGE